MKTLVLACFACAMTLTSDGQVASSGRADEWAGCYTVKVAQGDANKQIWGKVSPRFQLLAENAHNKGIPDLMRGKTLGGSRQPQFLFWRVLKDRTLKLYWGFMTGYRATLEKSGNALVGVVQPYSDYEPGDGRPSLESRSAALPVSRKIEHSV